MMWAVLLNPLNPAQDIKLLILKIKTLALLCDIFLHRTYLDNIFSKFSLETFWPTLKVAQHAWAKFTYSISIISLVICRKGDNYQQLSQQSQNKFSSEKKKENCRHLWSHAGQYLSLQIWHIYSTNFLFAQGRINPPSYTFSSTLVYPYGRKVWTSYFCLFHLSTSFWKAKLCILSLEL